MDIVFFPTQAAFRRWLEEHHETTKDVWVGMYKKDAGKMGITYAQALDEALCFGWIDVQKRAHDESAWIQRFTPRRAKSNWSKVNIGHIERLTKAKKMTPAGLAAVQSAKDDGRWQRAYDSARTMTIPDDFLKQLHKNKKATEFFETLNKANLYAIAYRLQTAKKPETRAKRMKVILAMMKKGEKFH